MDLGRRMTRGKLTDEGLIPRTQVISTDLLMNDHPKLLSEHSLLWSRLDGQVFWPQAALGYR